MNPFALTAEERAGAMMEPATKPDVGAFMDNIGALRAMLGPSVAVRMQEHGEDQEARWDAGERGPTPLTEENVWLADDVAGSFVGPMGMAGVIKAYHGSPHRFDRFDMSKIGTGEGAQAYGHGLYMAESPDVARQYKQKLEVVSEEPFRALGIPDKDIPQAVSLARSTHPAAMDIAARDFADWTGVKRDDALVDAFKKSKQPGALYTTRLDVEADDLLDWDKPLSEQSAKVRGAWAAAMESVKAELPVESFNVRLADDFANLAAGGTRSLGIAVRVLEASGVSGDKVSAALREAGIPGIRYLDQGSRGAGEGTRNFVIFDDSLIDIEAVDGKAVGLDMGQDARMARAKEMGFDTDTPLFHGTDRDITEFRVSKGGEIGPGVYVTRDATQAGEYARPSYGGPYPEGANVTKTVVKGKMKNMERGEWVALRGEIMDRLREENGGEWDSKFVKQAEKEIMAELEGEGFVGIYLKNPTGKASLMYDQGVVFDPANIRSVHAAFDPAKKKSADLLAASAGGGVAASAVTTAASDRKDRKKKP